MADLGDGGPFHFHGGHGREVGAGLGDALRVTHELVAGTDQPFLTLDPLLQLGHGGARQCLQAFIGDKGGGHLRHLADFIAKAGDIHIVMTHFAGDDHIADMQLGIKTTRRAGIDDAIRCEAIQQQGGGNRRGHLADPGAGQHDLLASQLAAVEFATGQAQLFDVAHLGSQQGNFLVHRTYDAYFHGVLASGSVDE